MEWLNRNLIPILARNGTLFSNGQNFIGESRRKVNQQMTLSPACMPSLNIVASLGYMYVMN